MATKGANMFEQHVEKIVLALAVAGAAYMGYAAFQPITIDGTDVGSKQVEQSIADSLAALKGKAGTGPTAAAVVDFPRQYRELSQSSPIDDPSKGIQLVNAAVPAFGPRNLPLSPGAGTPDGPKDFAVIAPDPVAPIGVEAELWEGMVADAGAAGGAAGGSASVPAHDQSAALIEGYIPIGEMRHQMEQLATQPQRVVIPPSFRLAEIYRIRVQRHERNATGWSEFKDVPATKATVQPAPLQFAGLVSSDMPAALKSVEKDFKAIVLPDFYVDDKGKAISPPILSRQPDKDIQAKTAQLQGDQQNPAGGGGAPAPAPGAAPAAAGAAPYPADAAAIYDLPVVPFTFWDETVQPNHVYQYRVEVEFLNPLYKWTLGLQKPEVGNEEVLTSGWVVIPTPIVVNSDLAFYIHGTGGPGANPSVTTRVYKKNNGKWYWSDFTTPLGTGISGQIRLVDRPGIPTMDVETGYTIVDAELNPDGNDVHVILKDASGNLISRDSAVDRHDPNDDDLYKKSAKLQAATAPATAPGEAETQPAGGPTRGAAIPRTTTPRPTGTRPTGR